MEEAEVSEDLGVWGPAVPGACLVPGLVARYREDVHVRDERDAAQAGGQPRQPSGDGSFGVGVRREEYVATGEQETVLAVPLAAALSPRFERLDGSWRDTAR